MYRYRDLTSQEVVVGTGHIDLLTEFRKAGTAAAVGKDTFAVVGF